MKTNFRTIPALGLGALNGAIYSAVQFILVSAYFAHRIQLREEIAQELGSPHVQSVNLFNARIVTVWFIAFFTLSSCLGHRYLLRLRKHDVLFWEAIGVGAIIGWNVVVLLLFWISSRITGETASLNLVMSPTNPLFGALSMGIVIMTNFIYGSVIALTDKLHRFQKQARRTG